MVPVLYVVIACYNEEEVLPETSRRILDKITRMTAAGLIDASSRIVFVDDGSRDRTWELISDYYAKDEHFCGIKLAHNRGQQLAFLAGLMAVRGKCDCVVTMDADLQDDIEVLDQFILQYTEGCEVVYGVRRSRSTDTWFKRRSALAFYHLMDKLGAHTIDNHADYRLLGSRALEALAEYGEENVYLRGIVPDIGFRTGTVYYDRAERFAGTSKYPLSKMLSLAVDGITSFSIKPLELIFKTGVVIFFICLLVLIYCLIAAICHVPGTGWVALVSCLWLLGGLILMCLGVVGVYVGKTYQESKHRPRYLIETELFHDGKPSGGPHV